MELLIGLLAAVGVLAAVISVIYFEDYREKKKAKKTWKKSEEYDETFVNHQPAYSRVPTQSQSRQSSSTVYRTSSPVITTHYNVIHDRQDHYVDGVLVAEDIALDLIHAAALAGLVQGSQPVECIPTDTVPCPDPSPDFGGGSSGGGGASSSWDSGSQSDSHSSPSHSCSSSSSHSCSSSSGSSCSSSSGSSCSSSSSSCSSSSD